ncbi:MAG: DUF1993 domain-containing protein, partial [Halioglobus sp.]
LSFYDTSVQSYLQVLNGLIVVLDKGLSYAEKTELEPQKMVAARLHEDMMPLHFQIVSAAHHSLGALQAMQQGSFSPPSFELDMDYPSLQDLVVSVRDTIAEYDPAAIESLADGEMVFKLGKNEIPFTNRNFLLSFSLPNFYFHATTSYSILRMLGVPLGKMDYIGQMKIGV